MINTIFKNTPTTRYIKNKDGVVISILRWGVHKCRFCDQKVISYNDERHKRSKKHQVNLKKFEKKYGVTIIEDKDNYSPEELSKLINKLDGN